MKIFSLVIASVTGLLLLSTMICGLWIKANNVTDASSLSFHMKIGISSVVFGLISAVLLIILALRLK